MWNDAFMIGNGERVTEETSKPVYRNYLLDCGIVMTKELFEEITKRFKIYYETTLLKNIQFVPKKVLTQTTSKYYFLHLDVKIPRTHH